MTQAVQLSGAEGGSILEFEPETRRFRVRTCFGTSDEMVATLRATRSASTTRSWGAPRPSGEARQAPDLEQEAPDAHIDVLRAAGWRSMIAVPLLRQDEIVGALIVRRTSPGAFPDRTVELLETLASQSVVAIHNARLFRELEGKTSELEVAGRHKSEFLASMSHELRTPLNAVIGFSDVLLEQMFGELNERQQEYVRDIRDSGRHLLELINEILDLSKVEAGRMELERAPCRSRPARARHGDGPRARHAAPDRDVARRRRAGRPRVGGRAQAQAGRPQPAHQRGQVHARRRLRRDHRGVAGDEARGGVRDTGIGIAEAEQARIFEAFQRGGREARTSTEGTGLGLTLSKRIVELHGGRLWMTSRPGAGSTFGFAIPMRAPDAAAEDGPRTRRGQRRRRAGHGRRARDRGRPALGRAAGRLPRGRGLRRGARARRRRGPPARPRLRPRAIVLDILLPRVDGWNLLARLKADRATAACPIVVVSMLDERGRGSRSAAATSSSRSAGAMLEALARCVPRRPRHAGGAAVSATVLVVEDNPLNRKLVRDVLGHAGFRVLESEDAEQGIALAR